MRILLDECVPVPLGKLLVGHEVQTTMFRKWNGISNGALLKLAELDFDVFLTADQNLSYEQNLGGFDIAVVQVSTNNLRRLEVAADRILNAIQGALTGEVVTVAIP
ncbi:MAG: DUF5615 family PIN-like protein [Fimbriimonadaceae bacterium]